MYMTGKIWELQKQISTYITNHGGHLFPVYKWKQEVYQYKQEPEVFVYGICDLSSVMGSTKTGDRNPFVVASGICQIKHVEIPAVTIPYEQGNRWK